MAELKLEFMLMINVDRYIFELSWHRYNVLIWGLQSVFHVAIMHRVKPQGGSISNLRALDDSAVVESGLTFWEWDHTYRNYPLQSKMQLLSWTYGDHEVLQLEGFYQFYLVSNLSMYQTGPGIRVFFSYLAGTGIVYFLEAFIQV
jgi:hypothetical protein